MTLDCQTPLLSCATLPSRLGLSGFLSPRNRKVVGSNPTSGSISAGQRVHVILLPMALLASLIIPQACTWPREACPASLRRCAGLLGSFGQVAAGPGSRLKAARAHRKLTRVMPTHQATATAALLPMAVPSSRPRRVSMKGVKGWYSANQRRAVGIDSVGTNPLPRKGRSIRGIGRLLAASTVLLTRPQATDSQVMARVIMARTPTAAVHSTGLAVGPNPMSEGTPTTMA